MFHSIMDKYASRHSDPDAPTILDISSTTTSPASSNHNNVPLPDSEHLSPVDRHLHSSTASLPIAVPSRVRGRQSLEATSLPASLASSYSRSRSSSHSAAIHSASTSISRNWYRPSTWRSPRDKDELSQENRTRVAVATAVRSVLGNAGTIAHDLLRFGADVAQFAPVPGLDAAAKSLLAIWDSVEKVKENRAACLRLTERCATILISVREDVALMNDAVSEELRAPQAKFEKALAQVAEFMKHQAERHMITQYLQRDHILEEITKCDELLADITGSFDRSISLRILRATLANNAKTPELPPAYDPPSILRQNPHMEEPANILPSPQSITKQLLTLQARENRQDLERDLADFQEVKRTVRDEGTAENDEEVLSILDISEDDQPDAIKTFQRIVERVDVDEYPVTRYTPLAPGFARNHGLTKALTWPLGGGVKREKEIMDREFIDTGLEVIRRLGREFQFRVPDWTITKFEILLGRLVAQSSFSHVYEGKWNQQTVAVKVLSTTISKEAFQAEVMVWKQLKHRHVLELFGASSGKGHPPWFFVSPFCKHGNLTQYLKQLEWHHEGGGGVQGLDYLRVIQDIARGMEYLHSQNISHGDLRARNILVDGEIRCLVSDFGQSRRILENSFNYKPILSSLRWQAPEVMQRHLHLTTAIDVYAYGMTIVEVLTLGAIPWPTLLDDDVKRLVLDMNERPPYPTALSNSLGIEDLLHSCWEDEPSSRPSFSHVCLVLYQLQETRARHRLADPGSITSNSTATETPSLLFKVEPDLHLTPNYQTPAAKSDTSPLFVPGDVTENMDNAYDSGYESPMPTNSDVGETRNALRYRLALSHIFHPTLRLALWTPVPTELGDVGFLDKKHGSFVKLHSAAQRPLPTSLSAIPSWHIYGKITVTTQHLDILRSDSQGSGLGEADSSPSQTSGRYSEALWAHRKSAYLFTENAVYEYLEALEAPKMWLEKHADTVLQTYELAGEERITRDDLMLVVGTLSAHNYALFVNHHHANGKVHFDVARTPNHKAGDPWGEFSTTIFKSSRGPLNELYQHIRPTSHVATRVSTGLSEDTLLIARLQIGTDSGEATLR